MVIQVCQLLSFPFALDVDKDTLELIVEAVRDTQIPAQLLQVLSWPCVPPSPHTVVTPPNIVVPKARHHFTSCWQFLPTQGCHLGAMQPLEKLGWLLSLCWPAGCLQLLLGLAGLTHECSALSSAVCPFSLGLRSPSALLVH